ncbi:DUF4232 domain-containing protein, partial [Streptomyces sp. NPDC005921]
MAQRATRRVRLLAATGAAVAALALTACEDGTGTRDEGASAPATTASQPATPTPTPKTSEATTGTTGTGTTTGSGTARSTPSPVSDTATKKPGSGTSRVLCNGSNTTVTAQPLSRPLNHLLLTVRNTGSRTCDLTYYPVLRFDEMQWVPQPDEATHPQAVTGAGRLNPRTSGPTQGRWG